MNTITQCIHNFSFCHAPECMAFRPFEAHFKCAHCGLCAHHTNDHSGRHIIEVCLECIGQGDALRSFSFMGPAKYDNRCKHIIFVIQNETKCDWDDVLLLKEKYTEAEVGRIESRQ